MKQRKEYQYNNDYGITTDIYQLPIGAMFTVSNGAWDGEIVEQGEKKFINVAHGMNFIELNETTDYGLSLYGVKIRRYGLFLQNELVSDYLFNFDGYKQALEEASIAFKKTKIRYEIKEFVKNLSI